MIRSILVPLDGSRFAEAAIPAAAQLARSARAGLRLVHVHQPAAGVSSALPPASVAEHPEDFAARAREMTYLAEVAARIGGVGRVEFEVCDGHPGEAIARCVIERQPDLLVMSTHGRGSLSPLWLGSVADYLLRTVSVPILLVRPDGASPPPTAEDGFRTALAAVDLSDESTRILEPLADFACLTQAHVTLLHVVPLDPGDALGASFQPAAPGRAAVSSRMADAQRRLDLLADQLRSRGIRAASRVVAGTDVAGTILEELRTSPAQVLALTTHGIGGHRERLLGSVADKVIRGADRSVLVLRPMAPPAS